MRHIWTFVLIFSGIITATVFIGLIPIRQVVVAPYQPVAQEFLPGHLIPHDVICHAPYYYEDHLHLYCQPTGDIRAHNVFITYDLREKVIVHTDLLNPHKTAGELILAWGEPVGYRRESLGHYLYWPGRYAYFGERDFSPNNHVGFITYDDNTATGQEAWKGFTTETN